ncbi:MAG: hypothetical protein FWH27_01040 [Planctomycetaceae bacterium]|nr:hypothetical protein [Planctomycetaceae bacterium]
MDSLERILSSFRISLVKIWDVETGKLLRGFQEYESNDFLECASGVASVLFSPDGHRIVSGSHDGTVKIWGVETGKLLHDCRGHFAMVTSVSFSPDGKKVISSDASGRIIVQHITTEANTTKLYEHYNLNLWYPIYFTDEYIISPGRDQMVKIWPWPRSDEPKIDSLATLFFSINPVGACCIESKTPEEPSLICVVTKDEDFYTYEIIPAKS